MVRSSVTLLVLVLCILSTSASFTRISTRVSLPTPMGGAMRNTKQPEVSSTSPSSSVAISRGGKVSAPDASTSAILASSFITAAVLYPVDLVRGLSMMSPGSSVGALLSGFKNTYGIQGFFTQGLAPEVSRATLMRGLKFTLYPAIHQKVYGKPVSEGTTKTKLAAACLTSIPEVLIIMPLEVSKVILTTDSTKQLGNSMFRAMNHAVKTKGLSSLMTGYIGVQYRQMSWGAGYFCSIGPFKKLAESALGKERKVTNDLLSGFAAGVFGAMLNTPGDTVRSVVMKRAFAAAPGTAPPQFFAVAKEIIKEKGAASLYSGFGFKAMHLGGGGALMALLVPQVKAVIIKQQKKRKNVV